MNERDIALMEANCIVAEDEYFSARPQLDDHLKRRIFQTGFKCAWEAAISGKMGDDESKMRKKLTVPAL